MPSVLSRGNFPAPGSSTVPATLRLRGCRALNVSADVRLDFGRLRAFAGDRIEVRQARLRLRRQAADGDGLYGHRGKRMKEARDVLI